MAQTRIQQEKTSDYPARVESALERWLPSAQRPPEQLHTAMRYAVLGGGKRIRPQLVYATGEVLGVPLQRLDGPACAVELIHAYSLIHDDLPAMDDDTLRRGRPTTHKAHGEATAILAGDALQTLAFFVLATDPAMGEDPQSRAHSLATLTEAAGAQGMVGGQALDMAGEGRQLTLQDLQQIHQLKTGALLRACVLLACDAHPAMEADKRDALECFARHIGLAFQVHDDVLDVISDTATLGKTQGADIAHDKATYPALLGLEQAKTHAKELHAQALDALAPFGDAAAALTQLANTIVNRDY